MGFKNLGFKSNLKLEINFYFRKQRNLMKQINYAIDT